MTNDPFLDHPNEEALERFLLRKSEDQELEVLETHIFACETCVTRLESLELQLTDLKTALASFEEERIQKDLAGVRQPFWKGWFTMQSMSWAGAACAALAVGLAFVPHSIHRLSPSNAANAQTVDGDLSACNASNAGTLSACRGAETATLPAHRPLHLRLDATDLPKGPVEVQVVNSGGSQIWEGKTTVDAEQARVELPQIGQTGPYFLRFYSAAASPDRELLREFRFEVK
jgi:hypothetical protein